MNPLREAVNEVMHYQFTNSRPAMHALQVLINEADAAADEIERLRAAVDAAVAAERERCAKLCEDWGTYDDGDGNVFVVEVPKAAIYCARSIRGA